MAAGFLTVSKPNQLSPSQRAALRDVAAGGPHYSANKAKRGGQTNSLRSLLNRGLVTRSVWEKSRWRLTPLGREFLKAA